MYSAYVYWNSAITYGGESWLFLAETGLDARDMFQQTAVPYGGRVFPLTICKSLGSMNKRPFTLKTSYANNNRSHFGHHELSTGKIENKSRCQ